MDLFLAKNKPNALLKIQTKFESVATSKSISKSILKSMPKSMLILWLKKGVKDPLLEVDFRSGFSEVDFPDGISVWISEIGFRSGLSVWIFGVDLLVKKYSESTPKMVPTC